MNAPDELLTAVLGEAEVRVPRQAAVLAYLEQEIDRRRPLSVLTTQHAERLDARIVAIDAPAIGAEWRGGLYAGVTVHDNVPHHLVLLDVKPEKALTWSDAKTRAEQLGAALPTRFDQLVLFKNLKREFAEAWYWSGDEYAGDADYAWGTDFGDGGQTFTRKSGKYLARSVRRVPI
jgi:hypothetical protein